MITEHSERISERDGLQTAADDYTAADLVTRSAWRLVDEHDHAVQFYESDAFLVRSLAEFIAGGLAAGDACIVVATPAHRAELHRRLRAAGLDIAAVRESGQYVALDAAATLATLLVDGVPDAGRFSEVIGALVAEVNGGGRRVRIFGEMVALLWADGQYDAALFLEALWNGLHATQAFDLLCAYPLQQFAGSALAGSLSDVCAAHRRVIPAESFSALVSQDDRLRAIVDLQQQARSLQAEIVQRKQAEREREELLVRERAARAEAEEAVRIRDVFLSIAAHELRTPLTTLLGNAELLQRRLERDGAITESGSKGVRVIADQAKRLNKMILGLLDVSRIESGQLSIERAQVDLTLLVRRAVDELQPMLYNHTVDCRMPDHGVFVDGDELRLDQVVQNLLANATKYSPRGGHIVVQLEQCDQQARLAVTDAGIGIPQHEQTRLFQRFYRASNAEAQLLAGMGIGLYVVKEIVMLHGGSVAVVSREDAGSTFAVYLPLAS